MDAKILTKGTWALVTGASAGLGQEFCRQLAARGVNVVMIARRVEPLQHLARQLAEDYHIETLVISQDLAQPTVAALLRSQLIQRDIKIRLLINNAAHGYWGHLEQESSAFYEQMICLNASSLVSLCREFLPDLILFPSSAIVNVSSQSAYQPLPYMAVYAATKAFVHHFSLALYEEWKHHKGLRVHTLVPGPMDTEHGRRTGLVKVRQQLQTPQAVVRVCLERLQEDAPIIANHSRTLLLQRLFSSIASPKFVVAKVGKMFKPDTA